MTLPKQIHVVKAVVYEVEDLVNDAEIMLDLDKSDITLDIVLERLEMWVKEDFNTDEYLLITNEHGEELKWVTW